MQLDPSAIPAYVGVVVFSLLAALALAYLATQEERVAGLREIAAAHAFNTLRLVAFVCDPLVGVAHALFLTNLLSTVANVLLMLGALRMAGSAPRKRMLAALAIAGAGVATWGAYGGMPPLARALCMISFAAMAHFFFAWGLYRLSREARYAGYRVVAALAAAYGLLRLSGPLWPMSAQSIGLLLASALYVGTAVALIIALQRSLYLEMRRLRGRAERFHRDAQFVIHNTTDQMGLLRVEAGPRFVVELANPSLIAFARSAYPGRDVGPMVGRDIAAIMREDYAAPQAEIDQVLAAYCAAVESRAVQRGVARHGARLRDGVVTPLVARDGAVTHLFFRGTDISELEATRRELQASNERLERLFATSPIPIGVTRMDDGRLLEANESLLRTFGLEREHAIGRSMLELGFWTSAADRERMVGALRRGVPVRGVRQTMRRPDGRRREILNSAEVVDWKGERAIVGFIVDVTDMEDAAQEIRRLNASLEERVHARTAELEQALADLESFSYSVSHDLRAPLRAMSSFATLLGRSRVVTRDASLAGYASRIARGASRMGRMVDELLRHSRLSRQPIDARPVALGAEARSLAAEIGEQHAGRRLCWSIGPLPEVRGDPTLLRLVLQNLMENAAKYTRSRDEARIEVSARESPAEVEVTVRDNGVGFDMAHAANLFGPFQRLHHEAEYEGTGIGLAHVRRIVERHGGRVRFEAAPGEGAAFHFSLPR